MKKELEEDVPEIAPFLGIVIRMFVEPGAPHHGPHFHAFYQNFSATFSIDPVDLSGGGLLK